MNSSSKTDGLLDQNGRRKKRTNDQTVPSFGNNGEFDMQTSEDESSDDEEKNAKRQENRKFRREELEEAHQQYLRTLRGGQDQIDEYRQFLENSQKEIYPKTHKALTAMTHSLTGIYKVLSEQGNLLTPIVKYLPSILEKNDKTEQRNIQRSKGAKEMNPFKINLVIDFNGEEHKLTDFTRKEVENQILSRQEDGLIIGEIDLKDTIREALGPYFSQIDEPLKLGRAVAQLFRGREFYAKNFVEQFKVKGDKSKTKDGSQSDRKSISKKEGKFLGKLICFCGGNLVVEYPKNDQRKVNRRFDYLNECRRGINAMGLHMQKPNNNVTNLMAHIRNFVPLMEREEFKATWEGHVQILSLESAKKKEEKKKEKAAEATKLAALAHTPLTRSIAKHQEKQRNGAKVEIIPPKRSKPLHYDENMKENDTGTSTIAMNNSQMDDFLNEYDRTVENGDGPSLVISSDEEEEEALT